MSRRTKQKGIALLRCPPAPLVWLPQQFTAPCRNQTSDLSPEKAMDMPDLFVQKIGGFNAMSDPNGDEFVQAITNSSCSWEAGP